MNEFADELDEIIQKIQDEFDQYKNKNIEHERRQEKERLEQNERLQNVENTILSVRTKVAEIKLRYQTQSISVGIQTELVTENHAIATSHSNTNLDPESIPITSPVIKLTNVVKLNNEHATTSETTSKKSIEKSSLEKLLEAESTDSNQNFDLNIFDMSSQKERQKVHLEKEKLSNEQEMSSEELEEGFDNDESARIALLNAMNEEISDMSHDVYDNDEDNNSALGASKPIKTNLKSNELEMIDKLSSDQNFSTSKSIQNVAPNISVADAPVEFTEELSATVNTRSIHDLQQVQLKSNCYVVIEPLDLSKYKRLSNRTFLLSEKIKKKSKNVDDSEEDDDDDDDLRVVDRLINAAYHTRSVKKQLRAISESGESDSYYEKDRNSHKRAIIKKFRPTEGEIESDNEENADEDDGDETIRDFGEDLCRAANLSLSESNDDKDRQILLNSIDLNANLLDDHEGLSCDDDLDDESSGSKKTKKKSRAIKKLEKEAKLKELIEADHADETEFIKNANRMKVPTFSSTISSSSKSSSGENESFESEKTIVKKKKNRPSTSKLSVKYIPTDVESSQSESLVSDSTSDQEKEESAKVKEENNSNKKAETEEDEEDRIESPKKSNKRTRLDSSSSSSTSSSRSSLPRRKTRRQKCADKVQQISDTDSDIIEIAQEERFDHNTSRQRLRPIIDDRMLALETQNAQAQEKERLKRIEEKRKFESQLCAPDIMSPVKNKHTLILDLDTETQKPIIQVDEKIVEHLKPHQKEGVKFMWDSSFEKVELIKKNDKGGGCILAHCMGLGKTLTTIALIHTVMANADLTTINRVLIVMPVNVLSNWRDEIKKWTKNCSYSTHNKIFEINDKQNNKLSGKEKIEDRLEILKNWFDSGGILLMSYSIFTRLITGKNTKIGPEQLENFKIYLTKPGPDLIVCDEGHQLKNLNSDVNKAVNQMSTRRRIVLTGTPLQNNLGELYTMVSFIKPNLLGTLKEFRNRFENPIQNGQHRNSTESDVRKMKKRAHVLFNTLDPFVNRKDYSYFKESLQPKMEYVLCIRLSPKQIEFYRSFLTKNGLDQLNSKTTLQSLRILTDFHKLFRIWTHPWAIRLKEEENQRKANSKLKTDKRILRINEDKQINQNSELLNERFTRKSPENENSNKELEEGEIVDDLGHIFNKTSINNNSIVPKNSVINESGLNNNSLDKMDRDFFKEIQELTNTFDINLSGKLMVLDKIIKYCSVVQDKLLVFSQSTISLTVIEKHLEYLMNNNEGEWRKGEDYFRMDGQTEKSERSRFVKAFNDPNNTRTRLFLISTKAGGIGINLIGANRCVIFDASWNPANDTQSIYRIYRIGQKKKVFIYRFIAQGTMEEKIYQRQISKESLSLRVIDEKQMERHFTDRELREMYEFKPDIYDSVNRQVPIMPNDDLLKYLLSDCKEWISKYHEQDSLLENIPGENLSEEERKAAWTEFEAEKEEKKILKAVPNAINLDGLIHYSTSWLSPNGKPYAHLNQSNNKKKVSSSSVDLNCQAILKEPGPFASFNTIQSTNLGSLLCPNEVYNLDQSENQNVTKIIQTPSHNHITKTNLLVEKNNLQKNEMYTTRIPVSELNRIQSIDQITQNIHNEQINYMTTPMDSIKNHYDENQENVELNTPPLILKDHSSESEPSL